VSAVSTSGTIAMTVRDSIVASCQSFGILATAGGTLNLMVEHSTVSNNLNTGVLSTGASSTVRIANSVITGNATGVGTSGGGVLRSFKNNAIKGNGADGTPIPPDNLD